LAGIRSWITAHFSIERSALAFRAIDRRAYRLSDRYDT
jgi:hypothetical protein